MKTSFDEIELSTRELNRKFVPLILQFAEDLEARMKGFSETKKLPFRYDLRNDMLHLFIASSENTISSPGFDGVFIDYHPETKCIVGITLLGYQDNILPSLEGTEKVIEAWHKLRWKLRLLACAESFAGLFGISMEDIENRQAKTAVKNWIEWHKENPTKLALAPAPA